mmetsp:Transcript_64307/g.96944  ORF Transcript_64307/g.96944 Transcript_64307/m.96944 type:complete len:204 (+) Transcript_64307:583-1194(+)
MRLDFSAQLSPLLTICLALFMLSLSMPPSSSSPVIIECLVQRLLLPTDIPPATGTMLEPSSPSIIGTDCKAVALSNLLARRPGLSILVASLRGIETKDSLRNLFKCLLPPPEVGLSASISICAMLSCQTPLSSAPPCSCPSGDSSMASMLSSATSNFKCMNSATSRLASFPVPFRLFSISPRAAKKFIITGHRSLVLKTRVSL